MTKTYFIKTYGCQMNVADSAKLAAVLEAAGYQKTNEAERKNQKTAYQDADIILINTCVVRQSAEDRAAGFLTSLKNLKQHKPSIKIVLCGCYVTEPGRDVKKQFPYVDLFLPPNSPEKLAEYLGVNSSLILPHSSFVTIMTGCDNFCSYCVVPYVRGREVSRPMDEVLAEIKTLLDSGVKKIALLGQNVNSHQFGLANLLKEIGPLISGSPDIRISFLTSHPRGLTDEIIQTVAELPYIKKDILLPLQSGDNEILKKMNRGYTLEYFIDRVEKIRSLMPAARVSTDILVGFPGETEEQFQNTLEALDRIKFSEVHMFAFSPRPGTAAATFPGQLPDEVRHERLQRLIKLVKQPKLA